MRNVLTKIIAAALLLGLTSCKSKEEKISESVQEGNKKIAEAQKDAAEEMEKARAKYNEKKIDADEDLAEASRALDDKKVDAQREVTDAVRDARKDVNEAAK